MARTLGGILKEVCFPIIFGFTLIYRPIIRAELEAVALSKTRRFGSSMYSGLQASDCCILFLIFILNLVTTCGGEISGSFE
jgi:hypothetical protein